jgi:hypothetical protein
LLTKVVVPASNRALKAGGTGILSVMFAPIRNAPFFPTKKNSGRPFDDQESAV